MMRFFKHSLLIGIIGIAVTLILFMTNWYYELVIPVFENSMDDGPLFTFIDYLTFYTPVIFMVLFLNEIQKALDEKAEFLKHKYYTNCPKCGAVREENKNVCSFCGASLIIEGSKDKKA